MYKYVTFDASDREDDPRIDGLGLGHMARDAIRLCMPQTHGFKATVSLEQVYELSAFVCDVEAQGNARMLAEVGADHFFPEAGAPALRLIAYLSEPDTWKDLPAPFAELRGKSEDDGLFDPVVIMVLAAHALAEIDDAVTLTVEDRAVDAIKRVARASDCLAYATGLAGYTESGWVARVDEIKRRRGVASLGGQGKSQRYKPVRDWVIEKYVEKSWASPRQAAIEIAPEALALSRTLGCELSSDRAFQTVYDWILKAS